MRTKLFSLGLLLSASGSLLTTATAGETSRKLTLKAAKAGDASGSTTFLWSEHHKTFAVRFDYDNLAVNMPGKPFSGVGVLDCENLVESRYYWDSYNLSKEDAVEVVTGYSNLICGELKRLYPNSPAFK